MPAIACICHHLSRGGAGNSCGLRNGLRLQADRRPAQMRPAREARSYKKCRVEITINFARLLSTRPARTIAHLYSPRRPASPSIPLRSIPLHEVEREAIYTLLPQAGEGMGESKYCFDGWRLAREPEKCTLAPVQLPNPAAWGKTASAPA